jgi:uncharacterized membrane protein
VVALVIVVSACVVLSVIIVANVEVPVLTAFIVGICAVKKIIIYCKDWFKSASDQ